MRSFTESTYPSVWHQRSIQVNYHHISSHLKLKAGLLFVVSLRYCFQEHGFVSKLCYCSSQLWWECLFVLFCFCSLCHSIEFKYISYSEILSDFGKKKKLHAFFRMKLQTWQILPKWCLTLTQRSSSLTWHILHPGASCWPTGSFQRISLLKTWAMWLVISDIHQLILPNIYKQPCWAPERLPFSIMCTHFFFFCSEKWK